MNDALAVIESDEPDEARPSEALTLFGTSDPIAVLGQASRVALALAQVIKKQGLFTVIQKKEYVHVEGWTLLGSMLGVTPQIEWTRKLENGWEARAIAVFNQTGKTVGAGEAQCLRSESKWAKADDYAVRGMAQTRAISRALRGPLGFVVVLAGFAATPADEMPTETQEQTAKRVSEDFMRTRATPPLTTPNPANSGASFSSSRTASEILAETRARMGAQPAYDDEDAVCASCGRKEALRPVGNPRFCAKANGGCGAPSRGGTLQLVSYGQWRASHK